MEAGEDAGDARREGGEGEGAETEPESGGTEPEADVKGLEIPDDYRITIGEGENAETYRWDEAKELLSLVPQAVERQKQAVEVYNRYQKLLGAFKTAPREAFFQALTANHKGDTTAAWNEMLDIASSLINDRIAFDNLTPEQKEAQMNARRLHDLEEENERLRREREEEEEAARGREEYNAQHAEIVREIEEAGYDAEDELILEVVETMALARDAGYDFVDARRAVRSVIDEHKAREAEVVKRLKVESLPEELVERILKSSLEKFKKQPPKPQTSSRRAQNGSTEERRSRRVSGIRSSRF